MILAEDIPVFQINLGNIDILLAASDYQGLLSEADFKTQNDEENKESVITHKNTHYTTLYLDDHIENIFKPAIKVDGKDEAVAFLTRYSVNENIAFILRRAFEMQTYSIRDFKKIPLGIRSKLQSLGIFAFRFDNNTRIQFLMNFSLYKSNSASGVKSC